MIDHTETPDFPRRAVLCSVQLPSVTDLLFRESLDELGRLAKTLGLQVAGEVTQRRSSFDPAAYLGPGKLADLTAMVNADPQDTVVLCDHEMSPSQARNIEKATSANAVLDRTALILEIFFRHARSRQAKLQVEMVRVAYMAPRMRESSRGKDRQRGGIGGKGAGESSMELDRRKIRDRVAELKEELVAIDVERKTQRSRRQSLRRVALCGYTNAGKSTLFHALTGSDVYIADKLFATLDTTVRGLHPETKPKILVSDTIGFIRNLPTKLVESFKSTLDEALEASLILHVLDCADPAWERHMATTREVLSEIGAGEVPQVLVFNKIDKLDKLEAQGPDVQNDVRKEVLAELSSRFPTSLALSAKQPEDVARLRQIIIDFFDKDLLDTEILVPYAKQEVRGVLFAESQVLEEKFVEEGVLFHVRAEPQAIAHINALLQGH